MEQREEYTEPLTSSMPLSVCTLMCEEERLMDNTAPFCAKAYIRLYQEWRAFSLSLPNLHHKLLISTPAVSAETLDNFQIRLGSHPKAEAVH
jgi:hypothetical protein